MSWRGRREDPVERLARLAADPPDDWFWPAEREIEAEIMKAKGRTIKRDPVDERIVKLLERRRRRGGS